MDFRASSRAVRTEACPRASPPWIEAKLKSWFCSRNSRMAGTDSAPSSTIWRRFSFHCADCSADTVPWLRSSRDRLTINCLLCGEGSGRAGAGMDPASSRVADWKTPAGLGGAGSWPGSTTTGVRSRSSVIGAAGAFGSWLALSVRGGGVVS